MEFKREDFSEKFIKQYNDEELKILMDFCESYNKRFGKYTSKEEIINTISTLGKFTHFYDENISEMTAGHVTIPSSDYKKVVSTHIRINDAKYSNLTVNEKKCVIYHELIHHFSLKERNDKVFQTGLGWANRSEVSYSDEVMTEFYATELLRMENINISSARITKKENKIDMSKEAIQVQGYGYISIAGLGKTYDAVFGKRMFDGKTKDFENFEKFFNDRFKDISDIPAKTYVDKQIASAYETKGSTLDSEKRNKIYDCYKTALQIFGIDKQNKYKNKGFDLYEYLKSSNKVVKTLPIKDGQDFIMDKKRGIPQELFDTLTEIDRDFIMQYIKPDIMQIQDESERNREINKISAVLNVLRENIGELSQEDIQNISFGKIDEYTHNGLDCIVIKAGEKAYQTFVNNSEDKNYQFMPYCKFKQAKEYDDILGIDTDENIKQSFEKTGQELGNDYTMSMVMGIGGEYSSYGIVESNGKFYTTSGEIKEVELKDIGQVTNNQKQQENKEQKSNNAKKEWINKFINSYEYTETQDQYNMRRYSETQEMEDVLKAIQDGTFAREDISKLDINENTSKWDIDVAISKIARLLKVADSLTIDGGRDYLEEFSNIPNINKILLQIKKTDNVKELFAQAEENMRKGTIPNYSKTQVEREKQNTILASAIEATKEVTKESQIEEQEKVISKIEKNQIEQTKTI